MVIIKTSYNISYVMHIESSNRVLSVLLPLHFWTTPSHDLRVRVHGIQQTAKVHHPTPRQQGIDTPASSVSSRWGWARLLKRVALEAFEHIFGARSSLSVGRLVDPRGYHFWPRHPSPPGPLQLAADPPPRAPARLEQGRFAGVSV